MRSKKKPDKEGSSLGSYEDSLKDTETPVLIRRLAASVIATKENVCPRFLPEEFGLQVSRHED